jgi:cyclin-dependent kinase 12/13
MDWWFLVARRCCSSSNDSVWYVLYQCYMKQLLLGLHYCHINQVLHRDIKGILLTLVSFQGFMLWLGCIFHGHCIKHISLAGSNLLIDNHGILKLADFGLARSFSYDHNAHLTNRVITLWYRPPELLLGSTQYGPAVDMWSVGCIFAELLYGKPILPGKNEVWFLRSCEPPT